MQRNELPSASWQPAIGYFLITLAQDHVRRTHAILEYPVGVSRRRLLRPMNYGRGAPLGAVITPRNAELCRSDGASARGLKSQAVSKASYASADLLVAAEKHFRRVPGAHRQRSATKRGCRSPRQSIAWLSRKPQDYPSATFAKASSLGVAVHLSRGHYGKLARLDAAQSRRVFAGLVWPRRRNPRCPLRGRRDVTAIAMILDLLTTLGRACDAPTEPLSAPQ